MSTKEEFEHLQTLLASCLANVRCGVDMSDVDISVINTIRKRCDELAYELFNLVEL